ncbi:MAG: dihydrolipoamide dehydrogenase [Thermoplasmata archaeon]|jgi:dihydrolipoamide dehydrogenase|nr:dihydrolipoamide dehydrogenase [Thermoplasmata archaeon]
MATTMSTEVLVIGAGPGGYVAAIRAAQLGKKVLCVEKEKLGGVCLNVGCIPSKALIHAAKEWRALHGEAAEIGIEVTGARIDFKKTQEWKRGVTNGLTNGIGQLFKANKVEPLFGTATFTGPNAVNVKTANGDITVQFQQCIVATGSRPIQIPGFAFDGQKVIDSTGALDLDIIPKDLVVIGGGFIGLEIGAAYAALGSKVTVVEMMDQLLPGQDPEIVKVVERRLKKDGVSVFTKAKAKGFDGKDVTFEVDGKEQKVPADKVLVAVGRRPNTDALALDKAGVKVGEKGLIPINDKAQTNVPGIYAIGDITAGPALAHKASKEGLVAAAHIAGDKGAALDYKALPWAVFVEPEIATVGLTEDQARAKGYEPVVAKFPMAALGRAKSTNATEGFVKVVADRKTDLLLGVHVVGAEASNVIGEAALAIEMGATARDLALTIHTHPTFPEALMEAAEGIHGAMIHAANLPPRAPR